MVPFAKACSVDPPRSGASVRSMELRSSSNHVSIAILLVLVDEVTPGVFDFLDIDIWSKAEDVGVVTAQNSELEADEVPFVFSGPRGSERFLEVYWGRDPSWEERSPYLRQVFEREGPPLSFDFVVVLTAFPCCEVVSVAQGVSDLF